MAWSYVLEMEKGLQVCKINSQEILWMHQYKYGIGYEYGDTSLKILCGQYEY